MSPSPIHRGTESCAPSADGASRSDKSSPPLFGAVSTISYPRMQTDDTSQQYSSLAFLAARPIIVASAAKCGRDVE